jgi:D-3-phosphoglycerate dehydrogenase
MNLAVVVDPYVPPVELERVLDGRLACRLPPDVGRPEDVVALVTAAAPVGPAELAAYPNLRVVVTGSVGHDHLDRDALGAAGIVTCTCATYCTQEVADHALACVVALLRGLPALGAETRRGGWDWTAAGPLRRIAGSTLGVVGLGRIGRALAERAQALGLEVVAHDPIVADDAMLALGVRPAALAELLAAAHAVSLHVPITPGSRHLIGREQLRLMRPDAVLVNVARGALVDLDALAEALDQGRLRAAALDVWDPEPPAPDDPRLRTERLLLTPHAAWCSTEAEGSLLSELAANLSAALDGRRPPGLLC